MESALHRLMKGAASRELAGEGYTVFFEPPVAPSRFLSWEAYRPDVLGVRATGATQDYAIVECETRPSARRLSSKNFLSVEVQTRLNSDLSFRRILVVPRGSLACVQPSVRLEWEVWVHEGGALRKFPRAHRQPN